jgi:membrane protease YdiL (CAAX protease family)
MEPGDPFEEPVIEKKLPFDNLFLNAGAINGRNEWWMYIFGILLILSGIILYGLIISAPLSYLAMQNGITPEELQQNSNIMMDPARMGMNKNVMLLFLLFPFVFALFGLFVNLKLIHKKTLTSIITAYEKIRFKRFLFGFMIWGGLTVILVIAGYFIESEDVVVQFNAANFFLLLMVTIVLLPIQSCTEEIIIRGYLMQGLSQVFKNGIIPLIITSVIFASLHMGNPEVDAYGVWVMMLYYSSFGLFLGALTLLDEGLELAMGIHAANNLISSLLITSPNTALQTDAIFLVKSQNSAAEFITWAVMALLTFIIFWRKYRWKNFNLLIK